MFALLAVLVTFLYGTLLGWAVHWVIHQRWSGFANKAHMTHHLKLYPPGDLVSENYRDPGGDNTTFIFTPLITLGFALFGFGLYETGASLSLLGVLILEGIFIGVIHDRMHTWFHLSGNPFLRFAWFRHLRALHFYHHRNMRKNLGIFFFGWDRVFRTFRKP